MPTSGSVSIYFTCTSQIPGMALNTHLHPDSCQVGMENSKTSLTMGNIILKAGHYSAGQTPSQTYSNPQLHTQNHLLYLNCTLYSSCNFVSKAQDPLLSWKISTDIDLSQGCPQPKGHWKFEIWDEFLSRLQELVQSLTAVASAKTEREVLQQTPLNASWSVSRKTTYTFRKYLLDHSSLLLNLKNSTNTGRHLTL